MTGPTSELVLFQVGARTFAAVVHDAIRIGSVRDVSPDELVLETALGVPQGRLRGIVVASHDDAMERTLVVDQVLGTRSVPDELVHPLPAFAAACLASGAVTGFVLLEGDPLLLVDLPTLVRERAAGATA
ncbi:chemotaxis protein CheW [Anaeromyxobacter sp. Fw109-5]|uniref:chemotaxis protein CheW n=1 Tax=Anaeromyxobacter sp. (strain Fw109-5) TaxID=404589 RepID=UPI0000ED789A|nr:chemotaxis protein CheW [Anaeromyxobacter sp. Fw109-5]ABS24868.1 CheW domain protein [Anaeromyxobacter sp. Fw109-5]